MDTKGMGQILSTITMFVPITIVFIAIVLLLLGKPRFFVLLVRGIALCIVTGAFLLVIYAFISMKMSS
ncbi:hypothetical protein V7151_25230 [Priestia megaterium]|uniref:hypothetical protein n=1 Tax=Priestia megaterium TaxID=1404 RepID=UPI002FFDB996